MIARIRLAHLPSQTIDTRLPTALARITVTWNPSATGWFASLESPPGSVIVSNRRITAGEPLLGPILSSFPGDIWCWPNAPDLMDEPGLDAWGDDGTHALWWTS